MSLPIGLTGEAAFHQGRSIHLDQVHALCPQYEQRLREDLILEKRLLGLGPSRQVSISDILKHHTLRVEKGTVKRNSRAHDLREFVRRLVIKRQNHFSQFLIEGIHLGIPVVIAAAQFADRPAGHALDMALNPPAI
jgi:hypothetical protein